METLEIKSARDLTANTLATEHAGAHSYQIDRHQFIAAYSAWQHDRSPASAPLSLMTIAAEKILMNDKESAEVAIAIRASRATVTLD